jgi:hypothetical protein
LRHADETGRLPPTIDTPFFSEFLAGGFKQTDLEFERAGSDHDWQRGTHTPTKNIAWNICSVLKGLIGPGFAHSRLCNLAQLAATWETEKLPVSMSCMALWRKIHGRLK